MSKEQKISETDMELVVGGVNEYPDSSWTGVVERFDDSRGFGFITPDSGGESIFVHFMDIVEPGFRTLNAGDRVRFQVTHDHKGMHATNVIKI